MTCAMGTSAIAMVVAPQWVARCRVEVLAAAARSASASTACARATCCAARSRGRSPPSAPCASSPDDRQRMQRPAPARLDHRWCRPDDHAHLQCKGQPLTITNAKNETTTCMMVVDVETSPSFSAGRPRKLFDKGYERSLALWRTSMPPPWRAVADGAAGHRDDAGDAHQCRAELARRVSSSTWGRRDTHLRGRQRRAGYLRVTVA